MAFIALPIAIVVNPRPCTKRTALLCPKKTKSALKKLRDDINGCPELVEALKKSRWNRNRNSYTAREVRQIAKYLCLD